MTLSKQEHQRKYYLKNKDKIIAKSLLYYSNNREQVKKQVRERYKRNPLISLESHRKWAKKNPEKIKESQKTWKERHPDKRKLYTRNSRIRKYGISPETYYEMLKNQGNECAICKGKSTRRAMNIDHDHKTGKVRGLLCDRCNLRLGFIEDENFSEKALQYLAQYK